MDVLSIVRSRNQNGNVDSYQVSRQSFVCDSSREKFFVTYSATTFAEENFVA